MKRTVYFRRAVIKCKLIAVDHVPLQVIINPLPTSLKKQKPSIASSIKAPHINSHKLMESSQRLRTKLSAGHGPLATSLILGAIVAKGP